LSVSFSTLQSLDPKLVGELQESLSGPLFERLNRSLTFIEYKLRVLEEQLRLQRLEKYGPGSEKLSAAQLELLELEPGVSQAEVEAESERQQLPLPLKRARREHPGRQQLPADLPHKEQIIACRPEQCVCKQCGQERTVIGYEQNERLDVEPAQYFVLVTKREKRACKACEEEGVACAPLPVQIIERSLATDRVIIDTVVNKYADHLPLYRQSAILERETGLELSRATLDGWVMPPVGRTHGASSSKLSSSMREIERRSPSWRRWIGSLPWSERRASKGSVKRSVTSDAWSRPSRCSKKSNPGSMQLAPVPCHRALWPKPAITRLAFGPG
jgi:transposase